MTQTNAQPFPPPAKHHGLSAKTLRRLERASGRLASASVAAMEQRLPWFTRLPADQRASVLMITQTGAAGFVGGAAVTCGVGLVVAVFAPPAEGESVFVLGDWQFGGQRGAFDVDARLSLNENGTYLYLQTLTPTCLRGPRPCRW